MARFRLAGPRFCDGGYGMQCELNAGAFSGNERNERAQGHCPFADVDAVVPTFLHASLRKMTGIETG
jgi:hypothetical protein